MSQRTLVIAAAAAVAVVALGILLAPEHPLLVKAAAPAPPPPIKGPAESLALVVRPPVVEPRAPVKAFPAPAVVPNASLPAAPEDVELLDETTLLTRLHDWAGSDPQQSLRWARGALRRFPTSPHAPEFEWNVVKSLFNMGRVQDAREEARAMAREYPDSDFTGDVEHHLLNTPPNP